MSTRYVEIDRAAFVKELELAGFTPDPDARGELVYHRQHHLDSTMWVKIYTSMPIESGDARPAGADAIRVLLTFANPTTGRTGCLHQTSRVYRTGSFEAVVQRTLERAREAYREGNKRIKARQR